MCDEGLHSTCRIICTTSVESFTCASEGNEAHLRRVGAAIDEWHKGGLQGPQAQQLGPLVAILGRLDALAASHIDIVYKARERPGSRSGDGLRGYGSLPSPFLLALLRMDVDQPVLAAAGEQVSRGAVVQRHYRVLVGTAVGQDLAAQIGDDVHLACRARHQSSQRRKARSWTNPTCPLSPSM